MKLIAFNSSTNYFFFIKNNQLIEIKTSESSKRLKKEFSYLPDLKYTEVLSLFSTDIKEEERKATQKKRLLDEYHARIGVKTLKINKPSDDDPIGDLPF